MQTSSQKLCPRRTAHQVSDRVQALNIVWARRSESQYERVIGVSLG